MITYEEALRRILKATPAPSAARVPLHDAGGLVLAQRIIAPVNLPPFDNSAVDGYAVRLPSASRTSPTFERGLSLRVIGRSRAGLPYRRCVHPGQAVRILTGAVVPRGADRVIMQEHVHRDGARIALKQWSPHLSARQRRANVSMSAIGPLGRRQVGGWPDAGRHIRRCGEDLRRGARVLEPGRRLRPQEIALLASLGCRTVRVYTPPTVSILATGDELRRPGERLRPGHIYDSNGVLLHALSQREGARVVHRKVIRDVFASLVAAIRQGLQTGVLLIAGGVSVGEKDLVRAAVKACGVKELFWRVNIKPGMPLFVGTYKRTMVFGLPGNPVSVFVTFEEFVKPALARLMGRSWQDGYTDPATLVADVTVSKTRRTHFLRVRCSTHNQLVAEPLNGQASHQLHSLVEADGWIRMLSTKGLCPAGTQVLVKREPAS